MSWPHTINGIFLKNWDTRTHEVTHYSKVNGQWIPHSWADGREQTQQVGLVLRELGVHAGVPVAILASTRYEWLLIDSAILGIGGVVVGLYPTSTPDQLEYCLAHSGAQILTVENKNLLTRLLPHLDNLPLLRVVVVMEGELIDVPGRVVMSMNQVLTRGRELLREEPDTFRHLAEAVKPEDPATFIYTSGTTGHPKGAILTHGNFYTVVASVQQVMPLAAGQVGVAFLPLAHALQRFASYQASMYGFRGYFAPGLDKVIETLEEVKPNTMGAVPRIMEKMYTRVMATVAEANPRRQKLFYRALAVGEKRGTYIEAGKPVPLWLELQWKLFDKLVFQRIKAKLGGNITQLISGGAPLAPEITRFFLAIGILVLEGYGLTETTAPATLNTPTHFRIGTVGKPLPGTHIKIAPDGEILIKGPGVFGGYYKNDEATREAFTEDGYFRSGDIGSIDSDGFLKITDRKKDIIITAAGKNIAPQEVENKLKGIRWIANAMLHADRRPYCVALLTLDKEEIKEHFRAAGREMPERPEEDPEVGALVESGVAEVNKKVGSHETIKKWRLLPSDFSVEGGELTPTLKLKRRVLEQRHKGLLDSMYLL